MNKATKTENLPIDMIDPKEDCRYIERVEITSPYVTAKYKNVNRKTKFVNVVKNIKTSKIGYIEINKETFDAKNDNESIFVFLFLRESNGIKTFEKRSFVKNVLKIAD